MEAHYISPDTAMAAPSLAFLSIFSPKMMAHATMTMTRLAVFMTDDVTGPTSAKNCTNASDAIRPERDGQQGQEDDATCCQARRD